MRIFLCMLTTLALCACASTPSDEGGDVSKANRGEAARINTQLGLDYMRRGDLKMAEEKLKRAIAQDSKLSIAHAGLGMVYSHRDRDDDADTEFREALSLDPRNPDTLNNYGSFLCSKGKADKAEELFVKAAQNRDYPRPELAWTNAGVCMRERAPDKAEQYLREALKVNPEFPDALSQFAQLSYDKSDYLRARGFLQRYEAVAAPSAQTLWLRWKTESALGDAPAARAYQQQLKTQFPEVEFSGSSTDPH